MNRCPDCVEEYRIGRWPLPCKGKGHEMAAGGDPHIHPSERVVVIRNPATGETRIPGRADRPIHEKYKRAGFTERVELETHSEVRKMEREKGLVHERSWYDPGGKGA